MEGEGGRSRDSIIHLVLLEVMFYGPGVQVPGQQIQVQQVHLLPWKQKKLPFHVSPSEIRIYQDSSHFLRLLHVATAQ